MQFEGNKTGEQRADEQPDNRGRVKHQDRHACRSVDQGAFDLFDIARRHVRGNRRSFERNVSAVHKVTGELKWSWGRFAADGKWAAGGGR